MSPSKNNKKNEPEQKQENQSQVNNLPPFDRSLPMLLLRARESVMAQFASTLKEHGVSAQQWRTLRTLDQENGLEITELSNRCYLLKPSMSRIIQNLETRGLIERKSVKSDQRRSALFITEEGRKMVSEIAPASAANYRRITEQLGSENLEQLITLIDKLMSSLNDEK
jgi:homoprotocatechuate degradation regulator HpaR